MSIHKTAIIDPSAKLGKDVVIDAYAVVGPGVQLGDKCHIRSHAILEYAELGSECVVYPFASIGLPAQHTGYKGESTKVTIGQRCVFREGVTVHRGTLFDKGVTTIGNDGFFMAQSHVAHDCVIGNNVTLANCVLLAGHVQIGDRVFISGLAAVHQFGRIGTFAMISGGTMAVLDVAPYCIAQGDRAALRGLNLVGMKRGGVDRPSIKLIKDAYKKVFLSNLSLNDALADPIFNSENPHLKVFKDFLATPKRGFTRAAELIPDINQDDEASS